MIKKIVIKGAKEHNLKNVSVEIPKDQFVLKSSSNFLGKYVWNKKIAKHYFCIKCGVYTHHIRRRDPEQISVNLMCVDDILIPKDTVINTVDGASHD